MFNKKIIVIICGLIVLIGSGYVRAQNTKITKGGYVASLYEKYLDKAIGYVSAGDKVAFQKIIDSKLVFILKAGVSVYVVDTKLFSGKIKIRPVGSTTEVWTVFEAVK